MCAFLDSIEAKGFRKGFKKAYEESFKKAYEESFKKAYEESKRKQREEVKLVANYLKNWENLTN